MEPVRFMKFEEYLTLLLSQQKFPVETIGAFSYWSGSHNVPDKLTHSEWEKKLKEFMEKKA